MTFQVGYDSIGQISNIRIRISEEAMQIPIEVARRRQITIPKALRNEFS